MREHCIRFHKENPKVWDLFEKFTLDRISKGFNHYSVNSIFEQIRWETDQADKSGRSKFKINNNHRPFYARRFMRKYEGHDGFFRTREQFSKQVPATNLPELGPEDFQ